MKPTRIAVYLALTTVLCAAVSASPQPASPAPQATAPMDLTTGKVDLTPVTSAERGIDPSDPAHPQAIPQSPCQTVEGTLISIDKNAQTAVVKTIRDGDVKIGLPEGIILTHDGRTEGCTLDDLKPGDRIYATVVTANGVRAIRLVSEPPANPMVSYIGIPVLLIMSLVIWRIRCKPLPGVAPATPASKSA